MVVLPPLRSVWVKAISVHQATKMDSSQCGKSIQLDLLSFAYTLANRAPEKPQDLTLARVEHLLGCVGLPVLQEAHGLTRCCQQLVGRSFGGLLSYTYFVHSGHPFSVGRVPGSGDSCGTISLCDALILEDLLIFVNHSIDLFLSFVVR
jgi:hypothetical protein